MQKTWQPFPSAANSSNKHGLLHPSETREHHFIAQTEQRMYALNPEVSERNRNIYRIDQTDNVPKRHKMHAQSVNIENALEGVDLYLLKNTDDGRQYNLEAWFNRYESAYDFALMKLFTLQEGTHPFTTEYEAVWRMKLLDMLRNPYLVKQPLGQYLHGCLKSRLPTPAADTDIDALIKTILQTDRTQQCRTFDLSAPQYAQWLAVLCAALSEAVAKPSPFECFAAAWLNINIKHSLFRYGAKEQCCLSDTAVCMQYSTAFHVLGVPLAARAFATVEIPKAAWHSLSGLDLADRVLPQGSFVLKDDEESARCFFNRLSLHQAARAVYGQSGEIQDYLP